MRQAASKPSLPVVPVPCWVRQAFYRQESSSITPQRPSMATRLVTKGLHEVSVVTSPRRATEGASLATATSTLSSSPAQQPGADLVSRMRAVLKRHQCGSEEEAVTACMRQAASKPSALAACSGYLNSLSYCQLHTQQHNYPVAPAFLY